MPWYFPWSESLKKRACCYLLQHYLGDFLKEKLAINQLTVDLYNGKGTISNVHLDVWSLNEILGNAGVPLDLVDGSIAHISVSVPWKALLNDSCEIEVSGMSLTFALKQKAAANLLDSVYSLSSMSMTTSMQMAKECLQSSECEETTQSFEGLEAFAQAIESVLARVKLSIVDTKIRFENVPSEATSGFGVDITIDRIDYWDLSHEEMGKDNMPQHSVYEPVAIAIKNFQISGLSMSMDEFPQHQRTRLREALSDEEDEEEVEDPANDMFTSCQGDGDHNPLPKVKFLSSTGKQNIKIKLKQNDTLPGPKVDVDYSLAALNIFLTPRQLHLLIDTISSIPDASSSMQQESSLEQRQRKMRTMRSEDYVKVEETLHHELNTTAWRGESLEDEQFFSMNEFPLPALGQPTTQHNNASFESSSPTLSHLSNISLGGSSSNISSKGTLTERASTVFRACSSAGSLNSQGLKCGGFGSPQSVGLAGVLDESTDVTHVKLRSTNLILMLLYHDPLPHSKDRVNSLLEMSDIFFSHVHQYSIQSIFGINSDRIREDLLAICSYDHLRLLASSVTTDTEYKATGGTKSTQTDVIFGRMSLDENLYEAVVPNKTRFKLPYSQTKIMHFHHEEDSALYSGTFAQAPCIKVKIQNTIKTSLGIQSRGNAVPKCSVDVDIGNMETELDLTMLDRMIYLLYPGTLYRTEDTTGVSQYPSHMYASLATGRSANSQKAFCQAMDETPHTSEQNTDVSVRCPLLKLILSVPVPHLEPDLSKQPYHRKSVHKEKLILLAKHAQLKTTISALPSTYELLFNSCSGTFDDGREEYHVVDIGCNEEAGETGSMSVDSPRILVSMCGSNTRSVFEQPCDGESKHSSPDSLEDNYPWMKSEPSPFSSQPNMYESEEMVMPANVREMNAFQEFATTYSKLSINCYFPSLQANLHHHDIFELAYNRLLVDLLFWQPLAPTETATSFDNVHVNLASHIGSFPHNPQSDRFFLCRSAIRDTFDSEETSFQDYESLPQTTIRSQPQDTNTCFSLHIDSGKLAFFPPAKISAEEDEAAEDFGHCVLDIKDGHLFVASGFKGQPTQDYIQVYANVVELYHNALVERTLDRSTLESAVSHLNLTPVITKTSPRTPRRRDHETMLLLALKCTAEYAKKRKENILALALQGATLHYANVPTPQSWLTQIMDFADVKDFAIAGYTPPQVITVLHLHLKSSAVEYKPLYIPLQALLTVESFSLSSNIIPGSATSLLRFIVEDSAFYICNKGVYSETSEYVPVMDMGAFELSLKLTDGKDKQVPVVELTMSNNMLYIRTCADSCMELAKLIKYFASDGDLVVQGQQVEEEEEDEEPEIDRTLPSPSPNQGSMDEIDSLMADAMMDETHQIENHKLRMDCLPEGTLLDTRLSEESFDEDDPSSSDEYCFLENQLPPQETVEQEPIINRLTDKPIEIRENFFQIPYGKHNLLGSPDDYPPSVYRYTVREMSVIWQMYAGSDFKAPSRRSSSTCGSPANRTTSPTKSRDEKRVQGGLGRNLDTLVELQMNKVRFQHDIYPADCKQIYRDVILIYDLEIRDRLASSQINKFLYRFSSENLPKQSSANMVTVKFLVTKPEDDARNEEAALRVSLQPLRLNIDQDTLFFLKDFFDELSGVKPAKTTQPDFTGKISSSPGCEPFQTINDSPLPSPGASTPQPPSSSTRAEKVSPSAEPLFFRSFVFSPDVPIRFDYRGKHVDIEQGTLAGLLIGLSHLNCSQLTLKRLCCRSGLLGPERLLQYMMTEWSNDIRVNQLSSILGGVGPAYSFVQLFQGLKDLVWMPVQQYRQDGRIVRGLQRGAHSFSTSTAMALLDISNRVVGAIQGVAELTFDMVSPGPSHKQSSQSKTSSTVQPAELREGMANAYTVLTEGLSQTASNLYRVAADEHDKKGVTGAVGGVLRQLPPTVVKPLILATEATSNVLGGAMNQLQPDKHRESIEKWKQDPPS